MNINRKDMSSSEIDFLGTTLVYNELVENGYIKSTDKVVFAGVGKSEYFYNKFPDTVVAIVDPDVSISRRSSYAKNIPPSKDFNNIPDYEFIIIQHPGFGRKFYDWSNLPTPSKIFYETYDIEEGELEDVSKLGKVRYLFGNTYFLERT